MNITMNKINHFWCGCITIPSQLLRVAVLHNQLWHHQYVNKPSICFEHLKDKQLYDHDNNESKIQIGGFVQERHNSRALTHRNGNSLYRNNAMLLLCLIQQIIVFFYAWEKCYISHATQYHFALCTLVFHRLQSLLLPIYHLAWRSWRSFTVILPS